MFTIAFFQMRAMSLQLLQQLGRLFRFPASCPQSKNFSRMCKINEISGDLFSASSEYSLAHCVSVDLRMGKGIAKQFRDKFGQVAKLKAQNPKVGGVVVLKDKGRFIYYLVTKQTVYMKPTYQSLTMSLEAMKDHMDKNGIRKLAMPRIGCGLDRLIWAKVKELIVEVFKEDDVDIVIYNYVATK